MISTRTIPLEGDVVGKTKPVAGDGFLKLISMIVAPIVFRVVVHDIAGARTVTSLVDAVATVLFKAMGILLLFGGIKTCGGATEGRLLITESRGLPPPCCALR
jgi:Na+/H+-dicarboxylate symporter